MKINELKKLIKSGQEVVVRINNDADMFPENFFSDIGMMAKIIDVSVEDDHFSIVFDLERYLTVNKPLMTTGWRDNKTGSSDLNYEEYHGNIPAKEEHFLTRDEIEGDMFEFVIEKKYTELFDKYLESQENSKNNIPYIRWLEDQVVDVVI